MEQFRHLSIKWLNGSASTHKTVVKTVASETPINFKKLTGADRLVLLFTAIGIIIMMTSLYFTITNSRISEPEYIEPVPIDTDNIA
ncbi:hypothetical protein N9J02_01660 [bacterium]|nr:hypothetical protein [bacterium]